MDYSNQLFDISEKLDSLIDLISPFEDIFNSIKGFLSDLLSLFENFFSSFNFDIIDGIRRFYTYQGDSLYVNSVVIPFIFMGFLLLLTLFKRRLK